LCPTACVPRSRFRVSATVPSTATSAERNAEDAPRKARPALQLCHIYWQLFSLNDPIRVCQLKVPFVVRYSFVYQNVQSSAGSTVIAL